MKKSMIRAGALCLAAVLCTACSGTANMPQESTTAAEMQEQTSREDTSPGKTFEEQYDLGVRFVTEGKYEEAIIAFTAALEINPKSVDTYIALADIYETLEDMQSLQAVLEKGVQETGDEGLVERLEELTELLRMPPEVPDTLRHGSFSFWLSDGTKYIEDEYVVTDERLDAIFAGAVKNGFSEDREWLQDADWLKALESDAIAYLKEEGRNEHIYESLDNGHVQFELWTKLSDGGLFYYAFNGFPEAQEQEYVSCEMDYRPLEGMGFHVYAEITYDSESHAYYKYSLVQGEIRDWLYNGAFTEYTFSSYGYFVGEEQHEAIITRTSVGTAQDELLQGELVTREEGVPVNYLGTNEMRIFNSTIYEQYEAGRVQMLEMQGNEPSYARIHGTYEGIDGEEEFGYTNDHEEVCTPYSWKNCNNHAY